MGTAAPDFRLVDQFNHPTRLSELAGTPVVLIYGNRDSIDSHRQWGMALQQQCNGGVPYGDARERVKVLAAAHFGGLVPSVLRPMIARAFRRHSPDFPLLLDWNGTLARLYGYAPGVSNVVFIGPDGTVQRITRHLADPAEIAAMARAIAAATADHPTGAH